MAKDMESVNMDRIIVGCSCSGLTIVLMLYAIQLSARGEFIPSLHVMMVALALLVVSTNTLRRSKMTKQ